MPKVGIVMGSDSDLKVMSKAAATLEKFGIDYEMTIISAHRMPDVFFDWAKAAEGKGIKVIIAGAGMAAHLPGMCAALFPMPVIGSIQPPQAVVLTSVYLIIACKCCGSLMINRAYPFGTHRQDFWMAFLTRPTCSKLN